MQYDPVKNTILKAVSKHTLLRRLFFLALDMLFLRQWYVKKYIRQMFKKHDKIIFYDAGAGFCQYSDYLLSRYPDSLALALDLKNDYLLDYAAYAKIKYPHRFSMVTADLVTYLPENKFNLAVAIDILEHIEEDELAIESLFLALTDGGKLIISTPSDTDIAARFTSEHVRPGYDMNDLIDKLIRAGFNIVLSQYSYGRWGRISWKICIKLPIHLVSYSNLMLLLLPIYYVCLYPFIYLLMLLDINGYNKTGNGIIIIAEKPLSAS